ETLGKRPQGRKVKGVIHWVSVNHGLPVTLRLYDRLFGVENPEANGSDNYMEFINPNSLKIVENCIIEPSALGDLSSKSFQFEREGYFVFDEGASRAGNIVFNRTISLRDSWV
ncbi:MAG: glutamine--tRNA ligase, partial [Gammaproteobacteria bacterium]|nr:glutamine--tRNA ligase [Gammaproteobacteria bacterium]